MRTVLRTHLSAATAVTMALTVAGAAHADAPSAYEGVEQRTTAQLQGQGLAHRHLPVCSGTDGTTGAGPMAELGYMAGDWLGYGWSMTEQGPATYVQTEHIRFTDGGTNLSIDGTGLDPETAQVPVFTAHADASWDEASGTYRWEAASGGFVSVTELEVTDDGWAWELAYAPGVLMRYDTTFSHADRAWHETGAITVDGGQTWAPTMEMTLVKTCDG